MRERSYEYTATGLLGKHRKSMFSNELHRREPLGKAKGRGYNASYPGQDKYYGMTYPKHENGVAKSMNWPFDQINLPSENCNNQIKSNIKEVPKKPSASMSDLLTHQLQQTLKQLKLEKIENTRRIPINEYRGNKTSVIRNKHRQEREKRCREAGKELWKMPRFVNTAQPKIDSNNHKSKKISDSALKFENSCGPQSPPGLESIQTTQ